MDGKTWWSQKQPGTLLLGFIPIIHEQLEDVKNKDKDLKTKIYYITLKTILQYMYLCFLLTGFKKMRCW